LRFFFSGELSVDQVIDRSIGFQQPTFNNSKRTECDFTHWLAGLLGEAPTVKYMLAKLAWLLVGPSG
jgi:hypothetical protein